MGINIHLQLFIGLNEISLYSGTTYRMRYILTHVCGAVECGCQSRAAILSLSIGSVFCSGWWFEER